MIRVNRQEEQSAGIYSTSSSLLPCEGFAIDVDIITVLFPVRYFDGLAYQLAELSPLLLCDPRCQGDGSHSSGLGDGNDPLSPDAPLVQVLGDLSGLPRAGLPCRVSSHNLVYGNETCVPLGGV